MNCSPLRISTVNRPMNCASVPKLCHSEDLGIY